MLDNNESFLDNNIRRSAKTDERGVFMYDNIGGKIKSLAKVVGVGGAVISGVAFFICIIIAAANEEWDTMAGIIITFLILMPGCIIASYPLYGFGELIEKVSTIAGKAAQPKAAIRPQQTVDDTYAPAISDDLPEL